MSLPAGRHILRQVLYASGDLAWAGKVMIKKGRADQFRFSLVGRNGQIVATSETYITKAGCLNGIQTVKSLATEADIEDQTSKEWAAEQAEVKARAATRPATKPAAQAARTAIAKAASAKKAARAAKTTVKRAAGRS